LLFRNPNAFFRARSTVSEDRVYQLLYVGRTDEQRGAPAVGTIFDSFEIMRTASPQS
jgi:hypothetical protein